MFADNFAPIKRHATADGHSATLYYCAARFVRDFVVTPKNFTMRRVTGNVENRNGDELRRHVGFKSPLTSTNGSNENAEQDDALVDGAVATVAMAKRTRWKKAHVPMMYSLQIETKHPR